jgi:hypothetical protein
MQTSIGKEVKLASVKRHLRVISNESASHMKSLLKYEYDFYHFIKQRFSLYHSAALRDLPPSLTNETLHVATIRQTLKEEKAKQV